MLRLGACQHSSSVSQCVIKQPSSLA